MPPHRLVTLAALAGLFALSSCAQMQSGFRDAERKQAALEAKKTAAAAPKPKPAFWRDDDDIKGAPKIVVNLTAQRAYFYKGKMIVGESNISTGRKGFETPPGKYHVIQKDEEHVSNLYGDYVDEDGDVVRKNVDTSKDHAPAGTTFRGAKMPYFLRFTAGYGMHAGFVPRYRASHGCIRMPSDMAEHFFDAAEEGTPVVVEEGEPPKTDAAPAEKRTANTR
jgi:lipoprotein-anchoring transpeptidase ErfK/SrfK